MSRINFCLITPFEAEQIMRGINISCRDHRHISRNEVLRLTGGGKLRPWLEDNQQLLKSEQITFNYFPIADWAMMPDGSESKKHVVLRQAREWRAVGTSMQWVPIGGRGRSTGSRTKTHCKPPRAPKCKILSLNISKS